MFASKRISQPLAILALSMAFAGLTVGCIDSQPTLTKADAELMGGRDIDGTDLCTALGWYGDGECDGFCPETDSDCGICPDATLEDVSYASRNPEECSGLGAYECPAGQVPFDSSECGCGCMPEPVNCLAFPTCDAGDYEVDSASNCLQDDGSCYSRSICGSTIWCTGTTTRVCEHEPSQYVGNSPEECSVIDYICEEGYGYFSDDCGCGCEPRDVCLAYPTCDPGDSQLPAGEGCSSDACYTRSLCGATIWCVDETPAVCTQDSRYYILQSVDECSRSLIGCDEGAEYFSDDCGCGCVPVPDTCEAFPSCGDEEREVLNAADCAADTSCSSFTLCGHTIWCTNSPAAPICPDESADYISTDPNDCAVIGSFLCADGYQPFSNSCGCGCEPLIAHCEAYPSCREGDREVSGECRRGDDACYEASICGYTIYCASADGGTPMPRP